MNRRLEDAGKTVRMHDRLLTYFREIGFESMLLLESNEGEIAED